MGVATNDGTATPTEALAAIGLGGFFALVLGYDAVAHPKPAPDMVLAFAAETGLTPAEVVVVGDNAHDLVMARAAGAGAADRRALRQQRGGRPGAVRRCDPRFDLRPAGLAGSAR